MEEMRLEARLCLSSVHKTFGLLESCWPGAQWELWAAPLQHSNIAKNAGAET